MGEGLRVLVEIERGAGLRKPLPSARRILHLLEHLRRHHEVAFVVQGERAEAFRLVARTIAPALVITLEQSGEARQDGVTHELHHEAEGALHDRPWHAREGWR